MATGNRNYGFVRDYAALGSDLDDIQKMLAAGYGGVLLNWADPRLGQAAQDLRRAGIRYGIWGDPGDTPLEQYAKRMAQLNAQYNPDFLAPDLEFRFKGYEGSEGWKESQNLANLWSQYLPGVRTAVTVMPNQRDFNYEAWAALNAEWLPQAYGANPLKEVYDPKAIIQTLIDRGVDPSLISPVLGPGHTSGYEGAGIWTVDDFLATQDGRNYPGGVTPAGSFAPQQQRRQAQAPARPRPKLSQTAAMIQQGGLKWGGRQFQTRDQFAAHLQSLGRNYDDWARRHAKAASALEANG